MAAEGEQALRPRFQGPSASFDFRPGGRSITRRVLATGLRHHYDGPPGHVDDLMRRAPA
jgi:hypothetical protein